MLSFPLSYKKKLLYRLVSDDTKVEILLNEIAQMS